MESKQNACKLGIFVVVLLLGFVLFILGAIEMAWAFVYNGVAHFFMGLGGILIGMIGIAGSASAMSAAKKQGAPASNKAPAPAYPPQAAPYGAPAPRPAAPAVDRVEHGVPRLPEQLP